MGCEKFISRGGPKKKHNNKNNFLGLGQDLGLVAAVQHMLALTLHRREMPQCSTRVIFKKSHMRMLAQTFSKSHMCMLALTLQCSNAGAAFDI
jgi:hypothetical protein